ncbi:MAG: hypothetical protein JWQ90_2353 [Hydrocarboniphaga sp.]|uniref:hypothetical protein n=1 Tax=Hydrocarboniphaga sp. TaxID=2033016 RepID=UPI0026105B4F|nr:hypothetical protein [Hydrocarboniphaga sp.]MDB5969903.1 hypothetical protein [Hydrocarboniphaga sp.]
MQIFRGVVAIAWLLVVGITIHAVLTLGVDQAGATFIGDFGHPWRAQFNGDFSAHLLLMAAWIVYREKSAMVGLPCGLLAILGGGAFSLAYIFIASFRGTGSAESLLLGYRAAR